MNSKKGNILISFILIIGLTAIVGSVAFLASTSIQNTGQMLNRKKALYLAEAGLAKAVWYLGTSTGQGGKGTAWRTTGTSESFAGGSYTIQVGTGQASQILITSEGDYKGRKRIVQVSFQLYGEAFNYAIYSTQDLFLSNNVQVSGDVFADGNINLPLGTTVTNGQVIVTDGHTVSGQGSWSQGALPDPAPSFPSFDPSYYNNEIATALASSTHNYSSFGTLNLAGTTIYAENDITISGTIIGPGGLVAGDDLTIEQGTIIGDDIKFIAGDTLNLKKDCALGENCLFYANGSFDFNKNSSTPTKISLLAPNNILTIKNESLINGIIYAGGLDLKNDLVIYGSVQGGSIGTRNDLAQGTQVVMDSSKFPETPPIGLESGFSMVKDSWKEL